MFFVGAWLKAGLGVILSVSQLILPSIRTNINLLNKDAIKYSADALTNHLVIHIKAEKLIRFAGIPNFNSYLSTFST